MQYAACIEMPPGKFFPDVGKSNDSREAISVCKRCEVQKVCGEYADKNKITSGVWGGRLRQARGQAR